MLEVPGDFVLAAAVEGGRDGVDVEEAAHKDGHKGAHNVGRVKVVLGKCEHGHACNTWILLQNKLTNFFLHSVGTKSGKFLDVDMFVCKKPGCVFHNI